MWQFKRQDRELQVYTLHLITNIKTKHPATKICFDFKNATDWGQFLGTSDFQTLLTTQTKHSEEK